MTPPNFFLAYASSASHLFTPEELIELLTISRTNNTRANLSGMLLYRGGNFLQALEGPEPQVRDTMLRISRDRRHRSLVPLYEGFHAERLFADWSMAFEDVSDGDPALYPGLSDYLSVTNDSGPTSRHLDHDVFEFFRAFRDHM